MSVKQAINMDPSQHQQAALRHPEGTCHIALAPVTATAPAADLPECMDAEMLLKCVEEEVARICQANEASQAFDDHEPNRRELLGVLAFAYARRVFNSEEIAHCCQTEPAFLRLCHGHTPFAGELLSFRRRYRPLLVTVLANVFMRAVTISGAPQSASMAALKRQLLCQATSQVNLARHFDTTDE
jgi:hypothetical protein